MVDYKIGIQERKLMNIQSVEDIAVASQSEGRCWQCGMGAGEPEAARFWIC